MDDKNSLKQELKRLVESNPDYEAAAIVSLEGSTIVSVFPEEIDDAKISPMTAAIFMLGERGVLEVVRGNLKQIVIEGDNGLVLVRAVGKNRILVLSINRDSRLGEGLEFGQFNFKFPDSDSDGGDETGTGLS